MYMKPLVTSSCKWGHFEPTWVNYLTKPGTLKSRQLLSKSFTPGSHREGYYSTPMASFDDLQMTWESTPLNSMTLGWLGVKPADIYDSFLRRSVNLPTRAQTLRRSRFGSHGPSSDCLSCFRRSLLALDFDDSASPGGLQWGIRAH